MAQLTPAQRSKFDNLRKTKGAAAAKKFRDGIISGGSAAAATPIAVRPTPNRTPAPAPRAPAPAPAPRAPAPAPAAPATPALTPAQRAQFDQTRRNDGAAAAKDYRDNIIAAKPAPAPGEPAPAPRAPETKAGADVRQDFEQGRNIFDDMFNFGDLPRLENKFEQEEADLLQLRKDQAMPNDPAFAGRRSADVQDILSRMKGGLEGYTAAENNAIWERSQRNINQAQQTTMKGIQDSNAGNMVLGAAATARGDAAMSGFDRQRQQLSQDLAVQNIDEKQKRLNNYSGAVTGAEGEEYSRGQKAIGDFETTLGGQQQNRTARDTANIELEKADRNAIIAGIGGLGDTVGNRREQRDNNKLMDRFYKSRST